MVLCPHQIANLLLEDAPALLSEATVRLPPRGHRWIAVYTGGEPGVQVARSTGLTNREAALKLAQQWEAEARLQRRAMIQRTARARIEPGGPSQEEVARMLNLSPRSVRAIEKRALRKLSRHPAIADLWRDLFGAQESR